MAVFVLGVCVGWWWSRGWGMGFAGCKEGVGGVRVNLADFGGKRVTVTSGDGVVVYYVSFQTVREASRTIPHLRARIIALMEILESSYTYRNTAIFLGGLSNQLRENIDYAVNLPQ
jgi:hypothetical protein